MGNVTEDIGIGATRSQGIRNRFTVWFTQCNSRVPPTVLISQLEILIKVYMQNIVKEESKKQSCSLAHTLVEVIVYTKC